MNFGACLLTQFKFFLELNGSHSQDQKYLSTALILSPLSFGLLVSICATKLLFKIDNTFFTMSQETVNLIGCLNASLALLGLLSVIFARPAKGLAALEPSGLKSTLKTGNIWKAVI